VLRLDPTAGATVVDSETGEKHGSFDRMSSSATLMPGLYDLRFAKAEWRFVRVDGGRTTTLKPVQVRLVPELKWGKARVVTTDGAEVFRFDRMTSHAVLPPGDYVVEVDANRIPFPAAEGAVLDVKPQ
jgi:hypothetical protein